MHCNARTITISIIVISIVVILRIIMIIMIIISSLTAPSTPGEFLSPVGHDHRHLHVEGGASQPTGNAASTRRGAASAVDVSRGESCTMGK